MEQAAADEDAPGPYRDFAAIRAVLVGYDELQPQQVIAAAERDAAVLALDQPGQGSARLEAIGLGIDYNH